MYNQKRLAEKFSLYIESPEEKILQELLEECRELTKALVGGYPEFSPFSDDIIQEVLLRLLRNLRDVRRSRKGLEFPFGYVVGKIRGHLGTVFRQVSRANGLPPRLTASDEKIVEMRDVAGASFEEIGRELGVEVETARVYYSLAREKVDRLVQAHDPDLLPGAQSDVGPDVLYELEDLERVWGQRLEALCDRHPNLSSSKARKIFRRAAQGLLQGAGA